MIRTIIVAFILCLIEFLVIVIASPMANPAFVLRFLPEDVREAAKDHPAPPFYQQIIAYILLGVFLIATIGGMIYVGIDGLRDGVGYWGLTARFIVLLYIMKAFDIIVQDQWLVMTVGYFKKIYPETSECAGWKDRGFILVTLNDCRRQEFSVTAYTAADNSSRQSISFASIITGIRSSALWHIRF